MKKTKQRLISILVTVLLLCTFLPTAQMAEGDTGIDGDYMWRELGDGSVIITSYLGAGGVVVIPDTLDTKSVTAIDGTAFQGETTITSIDIPASVTSIGVASFTGCTELVSVNIPAGITTLPLAAFQSLPKLTTVTGGSGLTTIENSVFTGCTLLSDTSFIDGISSLGDFTFANCTAITEFTVPSSVTTLGNGIVSGCTSLTDLTFACGQQTFNPGFYSGSPIENVTFSGNWTSIPASAFPSCSTLETVSLPEGLTSIGSSAFNGCTSLVTINLPSTLTSIEDSAFQGCIDLGNLTFPNGLETMGTSAFNGCTTMTSVSLPDTLATMGDAVFYNCTGLTSLQLPDAAVTYGSAIFAYTALTEVTLPEGMTSIGQGMFRDCSALAKATVLNSSVVFSTEVFKNTPVTVYGFLPSTARTYALHDDNMHFFHTLVTVRFYAQGGTAVDDIIAPYGTDINAPTEPTRMGYVFDGWFLNSPCSGEEITFPHETEGTPLYAKWLEEFTVAYNSQGGSTVASETVQEGETVSAPTAPTRTDYTFGGWYSTEDCDTAEVTFPYSVTGNVTLFAKWNGTVTFDSQGGSAVDSETVQEGETIGAPTAPTRTDYTFDGWYPTVACDITEIAFPYTVTADVTLYAKWEELQGEPFDVEGILLDEEGNPMVGWEVTLQSTPRTVITDGEGRYVFEDVEVEEHTLTLKDTSGTVVAVFDMTINEESAFAWSVSGQEIDIDVTSTTMFVDIEMVIEDDGDVEVVEVTNQIDNPQTGGGLGANQSALTWIAIIVLALVSAGIATLKRRSRKNHVKQ